MTSAPETGLTIQTASVLNPGRLLIELSDGRSIVLLLEQLLTLKPDQVTTEEKEV